MYFCGVSSVVYVHLSLPSMQFQEWIALNISQMKRKRSTDFSTQMGGSNSEGMQRLIPFPSVALMASEGSAAKHKMLIQSLKLPIFSGIQVQGKAA